MNDEELIARAREVARELFAGSSNDRDRLAAGLLHELADRLAAAQVTDG